MIPRRSVSCPSHAATQAANQSTSQSGNFLLWVRQPAALLLITVAGGIGGDEGGSEKEEENIQGGGIEGGAGEHIHANSLTFDCIKMQTHVHVCAHRHTHTCTQSNTSAEYSRKNLIFI